jgi:hypothetical protein
MGLGSCSAEEVSSDWLKGRGPTRRHTGQRRLDGRWGARGKSGTESGLLDEELQEREERTRREEKEGRDVGNEGRCTLVVYKAAQS